MNLDDLDLFRRLDRSGMIDQINQLPRQLRSGWQLGATLPLPAGGAVKQVILAGMGGSALAADLLLAYAQPSCPLPVTVWRDYTLPGWARGPQALVIAVSYSGNTEETLSSFDVALERGCALMAVTTGGELAQRAQRAGAALWQFQHSGQPRSGVGWLFSLLLAAFFRLGWIADPSGEIDEAMRQMQAQQASLLPEVPAVHNPAKRIAGQLVGRWVLLFAADLLIPVAKRWKDLINEEAKSLAQLEPLPEADHNALAGLNHPEELLSQIFGLFMAASANAPRNRLRLDYTRQWYMEQAVNTDFVMARGEGRLSQMWTALHYGDYVTYYLSMAYQEDPTPVDALAMLKDALSKAGEAPV